MLRSATVVALATLTPTALAHEDDPKLLDRLPPHAGPGWTAGGARAAGLAPGAGVAAASVAFASDGVQLLSWLTLEDFGLGSASGNDCWGYTSPSGRRYALMGLSNGTGFVEITDPTAPSIVATFEGPESLWRDVKTYQDHAYVVTEGGGGIQVFDLGQIDSGVVVQRPSVLDGPGTSATHNVVIDEVSGFLYRTGGGNEGLRIYSLANPGAPQYVADWPDRYVHDAQVVTFTSGPNAGRQIAYCCSGFNGGFGETAVDVLDVTDKQNIVPLSRESWPSAAYSHQAWLSEDAQYLYVNDELDEDGSILTRTLVLDVSDLNDARYVGAFSAGNTAVGHNLYVHEGLLYEANYRSGLRVFDLAQSPTSPPEVAFFDTFPEDDAAQFNGLWSNYPYFGDGIVIGSDLEKGLFVWYVGPPKLELEIVGGAPELLAPEGATLQVQLTELEPGALVAGSERLVVDAGTGARTVPLTPLGGGLYEASFPPLPCGATVEYYLTAESADGLVWNAPDLGAGSPARAAVGQGQTTLASFDMETPAGWVGDLPGDTAGTGEWTRVDPIGTDAQPADDNTPDPGTRAWVTGQGSFGGSLGENDVDGGFTTLLSPVLDLSGRPGAEVRYFRWYDNGKNGVKDDVFDVDVSDDGGQSWVPVERLGPLGPDTDGGWREHRFAVGEFVTPTAQVRLRFRARDEGDGSIVEAAIDDVSVVALDCPDCDGNGIADGVDVLNGAPDADEDFVPDACRPLVGAPGAVSLSAGGAQDFDLDAGPGLAQAVYLLLASGSGTDPGLPLAPGVELPLVPDAFTDFSLTSANSGPYTASLGLLDAEGRATAALALPPGTLPELAGLTLFHAFVTLDGQGVAGFASNPVPLELVP
jgi:choice-of-anchor B domain-containing protein